jgi:hypothetical protein
MCRLQLLLVLASAVILRSESRETHDYLLLSQMEWATQLSAYSPNVTTLYGLNRKHLFQQYPYFCVFTDPFLRNGFSYFCVQVHFRRSMFTEPLPSNVLFWLSGFMLECFDIYSLLFRIHMTATAVKAMRKYNSRILNAIHVLNLHFQLYD